MLIPDHNPSIARGHRQHDEQEQQQAHAHHDEHHAYVLLVPQQVRNRSTKYDSSRTDIH